MSFLDNFKTAGLNRQILLATGAFIMICVIGAVVYFGFLRTSYQVLFTGLRTSDAATIVAELDKKKLPYQLRDGGSTILVPSNLVDSTRLDVMSDDSPVKGTVGFELFNKSDMGLTEFAQRINYQRALQGELARTIMTLEAVDTARIHLSLPEPAVFREDRRTPKASATIVPRAGKQLSPAAVTGIRRLIAAAVPDLAPADVVVLDQRGELLGGDEPQTEAAAFAPAPPSPSGALADKGSPESIAAASAPWAKASPPLFASASAYWTTLLVALLAPLLLAAALLARRRMGPRSLTELERTRFVDQLRLLMEKGGANVDSSL